ncbi:hypothetical protein NIES4101_62960 [Calothrix sp. NIES-4101]|nr:hypothetical protein NIES4101_62960 [Calothrix sp. NIES-4101]
MYLLRCEFCKQEPSIMNHLHVLQLLPSQGLEPRQFLRYCFGIAEFSPESIWEEETNSQYRKNCVTVLSSIFNVERATVRNWGNDLNFEGIPNYCKIGLAYVHAGGMSSKEIVNIIDGRYIPPQINPQTFLETILLNGLTEQQKLRAVSHSDFHKSCIKILTQVLHVGTRSVQKWGQDISFSKMPRIHKHTLAYALAAISQARTSNTWHKAA